jgi:beta-ribofuranosylaminobenzene 5'-phosphate synthase
VGDHFAPAQGGRFTSPAVADALAWLETEGAAGVGQSSWGPTGFALLPDAATAERLRRRLEERSRGGSLCYDVVAGRNRGAELVAL